MNRMVNTRYLASGLWLPRVVASPAQFDAAIFLDARGRIIEMNAAAERLVERGNLVAGHMGQPALWAWSKLQQLVAESLRLTEGFRVLAVADPTGVRHNLIVKIDGMEDWPDGTIGIFVRDVVGLVGDQVRQAVGLFGLTPSEHMLAESVLLGRSLEAHARLRGSALSTVRKQLSAIYEKTSTCRQTEMVATLMGVSGVDDIARLSSREQRGERRRRA
jgi:hypothetical protein